jgi:hypothetical protein
MPGLERRNHVHELGEMGTTAISQPFTLLGNPIDRVTGFCRGTHRGEDYALFKYLPFVGESLVLCYF